MAGSCGEGGGNRRLAERIESGIGHTRAMMAMSMMDQLAPGGAAMLADQVNPDGSPWEGCARTFLQGAIAELSGLGYELQASFEPEFSLGRYEGASFTPIDESLC